MLKMPTVDPLFLTYSQMNNKYAMEKWVNSPHISIDEKNLQNLGLRGKVNSM